MVETLLQRPWCDTVRIQATTETGEAKLRLIEPGERNRRQYRGAAIFELILAVIVAAAGTAFALRGQVSTAMVVYGIAAIPTVMAGIFTVMSRRP